jgi:uncharacterized protein
MAGTRFTALPLFPLRTVLFPGGLLSLKIFEARYLDLISRCLRTRESFGVICLAQGAEAGPQHQGVRMESVGVLARIDDVDGEQAGILQVRCTGTQRFQLSAAPLQTTSGGLWSAAAELLPDDEAEPPAPEMKAAVDALAQAALRLKAQGHAVIAEPLRLSDAGWVANRWCELLPINLSARQKLMELPDPQARLRLVDQFLRSRQVIGD